ncbi:hypothetical protein JQC67_14950 [Aurantibacter crassamenti]|uniref:hypothetical protein n=1 Tax=Aurantibacter crassamenti TaxID=1837375 RepID=UPI00193971F6|nr:hypothetical protein [Aurantibacter crassamenti]MBM1107450.1 hypothetical protein [Aurantibacter crassamenti]
MRLYLYSILVLVLLIIGNSCRKNFEYAPSAGNLEFSKDTVFLDTVFSNIGSSTYSLKVYNPTRDDIEIPSIRLQQGAQSGYRLNVDGVAGKSFENIPILAQDSMFINIETTFDASSRIENEILYTDKLLFDVDPDEQVVELVTLVKNAVFLYPNKNSEGIKETISLDSEPSENGIVIEGFTLNDNQLQFTNEKPYVIYGYAAVPEGKTLTMDPGTRVHFHKDSGIFVKSGGKIEINGSLSTDSKLLENEVIFEGDRLEPQFNSIPGQWGALIIATGSTENTINHLTLNNATVGIKLHGNGDLNKPTLTMKNSQIQNSSNINLWAKSASIEAENLVLGSAGGQSLHCNLGGKYDFKHCTIANYWSNSFRQITAVYIDNFFAEERADLINATFTNCIIYGSTSQELTLASNETNTFNFSFINCLIKLGTSAQLENSELYDLDNQNLYQNNIYNEPVDFFDSFGGDFRINESSAANASAQQETAILVPVDILGKDRTQQPDIGAFEINVQN